MLITLFVQQTRSKALLVFVLTYYLHRHINYTGSDYIYDNYDVFVYNEGKMAN